MANARKRAPIQPDPAESHNQAVLERLRLEEAERQAKQNAADTCYEDLDLGLKKEAPKTALEFMRDEFDKKNFGNEPVTYTRVIYGPHMLLTNCPGLKERIQRYGLEDVAAMTKEAILSKGPLASEDPFLQQRLHAAIKAFGVESVAEAFAKKILEIPRRTVQVEADRGDEDVVIGRPLEEAVRRYGNPGMRPAFFSDKVINTLGMRGYQPVRDEHGEVVKVGTLMMVETPEARAEARAHKLAERAREELIDQEQAYMDNQIRFIRESGKVGAGSMPLGRGEHVVAKASESERLLGEDLAMGINIERDLEAQ